MVNNTVLVSSKHTRKKKTYFYPPYKQCAETTKQTNMIETSFRILAYECAKIDPFKTLALTICNVIEATERAYNICLHL